MYDVGFRISDLVKNIALDSNFEIRNSYSYIFCSVPPCLLWFNLN